MNRFRMNFSSLQDSRRQERITAVNYDIGMHSQKRTAVELKSSPAPSYSILVNDGNSAPQYQYSIPRSSLTSQQWVQSAFGDVLKNGGRSGCSVCGGKK